MGINPGLRSAALGRHFAGFSNRFWRVLHGAGLTSTPLTCHDDERLPALGYGWLTSTTGCQTSRFTCLPSSRGALRRRQAIESRANFLEGCTVATSAARGQHSEVVDTILGRRMTGEKRLDPAGIAALPFAQYLEEFG